MEKRYQVFISSTFQDLQEERKEVMQALLELDCMPAGMELFPAANEDQWSLIKKVIDDSDYYILIVAGRYGSVNEDKGISYTQMEYEYALETGKPVIAFLHKEPGKISNEKCDNEEGKRKKLEEFKTSIQERLVRYWTTPQELGSVVSRSMIKLIKSTPAVGWVKADSIVDEKSVKEIAALQKENSELKNLLELNKTTAPKGSEKLAQGKNKILINFNFKGYCVDSFGENEYYLEDKFNFTWDDIFSFIGPSFMGETYTDETFYNLLGKFIEDEKKVIDYLCNKYPDYGFGEFCINQKSYNLIKIQFKALGLITYIINKDNHSKHWELTEYGEFYITQMLAIKKLQLKWGGGENK